MIKVNVSHESFMRSIKSLNDPVSGDPGVSEFVTAHNIKNIHSHDHVHNGFTFEFNSKAAATMFMLRFL